MPVSRRAKWIGYAGAVLGTLASLAVAAVLLYFDRNEDRLFYVGRDIAGDVLPNESMNIPWDTVFAAASDGGSALLLHSLADVDTDAWAIVFHGAENTLGSAGSVEHYRLLREAGFNVLAVEMRGYGLLRAVAPSESGIYADATAAWLHLTRDRGVDPARIVLYGSSLGAAAATLLASEQAAAGLITNGAFTSAPDLVRVHYRWLPARQLMHNRFDNLGRAPQIEERWLIFHGQRDSVVPLEHGRDLLDAAPEAELIVFDGGHDSAFESDYRARLVPVLRDLRQRLNERLD